MLARFIIIFTCSLLPTSVFSQDILSIEKVNRNPYFKYIIGHEDDEITYYLSEFHKEKELPLIVYVHGSGYQSLFAKNGESIVPTSGHISLPYIAQDKAKVLIIEKPGVDFLDQVLPNERNNEFDEKFSLENWSERIEVVIEHVFSTEKIDASKIMLIGHSEGGVVVARLANMMKERIANVCIMAGEGPSQLYSLYSLARSGEFFKDKGETPDERTSYVLKMWKEIQSKSNSTEHFFWGFSYLRWHSFLSTSVMDELEDFPNSVLIIQGDQDKNVNPETASILFTDLTSKGIDVGLVTIENADHSFSNAQNSSGWDAALKQAIEWFLK